jgi:PIN domain nuclease of toxin-antitoxin system
VGTMRCLLDTHTLLWWLFDDPKLSHRARTTIAAPENEILVSAASAWEIATKYRIGKLPEAGDIVSQFPLYLRKARFTTLEVSVDHALLAGSLPGPHRDPY